MAKKKDRQAKQQQPGVIDQIGQKLLDILDAPLNGLTKSFKVVSDDEAGPKIEELTKSYQRTSFSAWLPYLAYDSKEQLYYNADNSFGLLWECSPVPFLGEKGIGSLGSLLKMDFPKGTMLQCMLFPDDAIDGILDEYKRLKTRPDAVIQEAAKQYADHISKGRRGFSSMAGIKARNFRVFLSLSSPKQLPKEVVANILENLKQANLNPRPLPPGGLLDVLRRIFNKHTANTHTYNDSKYIRDQIVQAETSIEVQPSRMKIGERYASCLSVKTPPNSLHPLEINNIIGGFRGREDDNSQLNNAFIWNTTVFWGVTTQSIKQKANVMTAQRAGGSIAKEIRRRVTELDWVLDDVENTPYCNVLTSMWVFGDDEDDLNQGMARARNLWEKQGFVMQVEDKIMVPMFYASLPFGFKDEGSNVATFDRDFQMSCEAAVRLLPVQGDFAGNMKPVLLFVSRKGQLASIDLFDEGVNNHNFLTCAETGAGKSFVNNFIVQNYFASGAKMRLTDIGYSYEKQCMTSKGRFIDVGDPKLDVVLNPFVSAGNDADDQAGNKSMAANIILAMVYSSTGTGSISETHYSLAKDAVEFAYKRDGGTYGVDHVYEYLAAYPNLADADAIKSITETAHEMAFNIRDWTSKGPYGRLVNGPNALDISSDEFVVLELEQLLHNHELFSVISMQVINAITQDLYLSDRSTQRFMLFDEAWKYFGSAPMIAKIIEEGYRRARKYKGATGIITQSPLDLKKFGPAGDVIMANSAFKFFLQSSDYQEAVNQNILSYNGLLLELAKSVRNNKPRYSEILFDTPFGAGVSRFQADPWTYWMNTSDGGEVAKFKRLLMQGYDAKEAIDTLSGVNPTKKTLEAA